MPTAYPSLPGRIDDRYCASLPVLRKLSVIGGILSIEKTERVSNRALPSHGRVPAFLSDACYCPVYIIRRSSPPIPVPALLRVSLILQP